LGERGHLVLGAQHVAVGRFDGGHGVTEELGHMVDGRAGFEQVGGVGVAELVGMGVGQGAA
jgi:hypothetical protein